MIKNTISLSWRIGRAVMLANKQGRIGDVGNVVIDALGGPSTGRVLFAGKVIEVTRRVYKGHTVGEVTIAPLSQDDKVEDASDEYDGILKSEKETLDKTDVQYRSRMRTSMPSGCATASRVSWAAYPTLSPCSMRAMGALWVPRITNTASALLC
jgi:hypothetical protein